MERIEKLCLSLRTFPNRGTLVSGPVPGLRITGFERRASILFEVTKNTVEILRILHGGQDIGPVLERLLTM